MSNINEEKCKHTRLESNMMPLHCIDCGAELSKIESGVNYKISPKEECIPEVGKTIEENHSPDVGNMVGGSQKVSEWEDDGFETKNETDIKSFIRSLLSSTEKRVSQDIIKMIKEKGLNY